MSILTPVLRDKDRAKKGKLARGESDREMKIRLDKMRAFCDFSSALSFSPSGSMLANLHSMLEEALTLSDSKAVMEIYAQALRTEQGKGGGM